MIAAAAQVAAPEEPIPAANPVSGSHLPHIERRGVRRAVRHVMREAGGARV